MWLLNTTSYALELIENPLTYRYAILSHTWGRGEVTFQDIANIELARTKPGFSKIERTCQLARQRGIDHAWVDTCCIDKSSSAELAEAINSMFQWYKRSAICFVFLSDLLALDDTSDSFPDCRWLRRGWTLQELIASENIEFYDQEWNIRGTKLSLQSLLSRKTGIDSEVLRNSDVLPNVSVARRMSWAAERSTSKLEDRAYCLFGIFDVHLPLIYGEGLNAFTRLQEAIAQDNNDLSLLAWTSDQNQQDYRGAFARSPTEFRRCGSVRRIMDPAIQRTEFLMTNKGLYISTTLSSKREDFLLNLQCVDSSIQQAEGHDGIIVIRVVRTEHGYVRRGSDRLVTVSHSDLQLGPLAQIHISKDISPKESHLIKTRLMNRFLVECENMSSFSCSISRQPSHLWDKNTNSFLTGGYESFTGLLEIEITGLHDPNKPPEPPARNNLSTSSSAASNVQNKNNREVAISSKKIRDSLHDSLHKLYHCSNFVVIFGLEGSEQTHTTEHASEAESLKPWAAIYGNAARNIFPLLTAQKHRYYGFPYGLSHIRELLLGGSSSSMLPKTFTFYPEYYSDKNTLEETPDFVSESQLQLKLSTRVIENNPIGMFLLRLTVEAKD